MFERDLAAAEAVYAVYTPDYFAEAHRRLLARRDLYRRALEEDAQNSIGRYLVEYSVAVNEAALRRCLGVTTLSREHAFEARHFAHGNVGCLVDWLRGEVEATPEQLAACMFACMPPTLAKAYADRTRPDR